MTRLTTWTARFSTHDLEGLLALYDRDAVFWGTSSQALRDGKWLIVDHHSSSVPAAPAPRH